MNSHLQLKNNRLPQLRNDTSNAFQSFILSEHEVQYALQSLSPMFLAYLQNKIAAYATQYLVDQLRPGPNFVEQATLMMEHAAKQGKLQVLQELMFEILDAQEPLKTKEVNSEDSDVEEE